jgi:GDPmannose 4,6-dehydratase
MKTSLICGISGQDGAYLAQLLLAKGHTVYGTSRDAQVSSFQNLEMLGIKSNVHLRSMAINDFRSVIQVITKVCPDEIYNLAGQTSVSLSFEQPVEALESIALGTLNILEAIRFINAPIKFYSAASSEVFGDTRGQAANELTPFSPRSPYAVAKATAFWEVANYREAYGLFACSGILFNHESPLRPERFVTKKIVATAIRIAEGSREKLILGNIDIERDWGWAPEYVEAMYLMLQQSQPNDYVISTGNTLSLSDFVNKVFSELGIEWQSHVIINKDLFRPTDIAVSRGNPSKAAINLNWTAKYQIDDIINGMIYGCKNSL